MCPDNDGERTRQSCFPRLRAHAGARREADNPTAAKTDRGEPLTQERRTGASSFRCRQPIASRLLSMSGVSGVSNSRRTGITHDSRADAMKSPVRPNRREHPAAANQRQSMARLAMRAAGEVREERSR